MCHCARDVINLVIIVIAACTVSNASIYRHSKYGLTVDCIAQKNNNKNKCAQCDKYEWEKKKKKKNECHLFAICRFCRRLTLFLPPVLPQAAVVVSVAIFMFHSHFSMEEPKAHTNHWENMISVFGCGILNTRLQTYSITLLLCCFNIPLLQSKRTIVFKRFIFVY